MVAAVPIVVIRFHAISTRPGPVIEAPSTFTRITFNLGRESGRIIKRHENSVSIHGGLQSEVGGLASVTKLGPLGV